MSENNPPTGNSKRTGKFFLGIGLLALALVLAVVLLFPAAQDAVVGIFLTKEKKLRAARERIRAAIRAELASQPLPGMTPAPTGIHIVPTGLTNHPLRAIWHRTPEGSDAFPVALFRALNDPKTGRPLIESFASYGFIPAPGDDTGLPVGFSRLKAKGHDFVLTGINCATCHSTQITYRGKTLHIDGAPNLLDVEAFFRGVLGALKGILEEDSADRVKFLFRFAYYNAIELEKMAAAEPTAPAPGYGTRPAAEHHDLLLAFLGERLKSAVRVIASFELQTPAGPGRADSFGIIRNLLMTEEVLGAPGNFQPMTAPVSMPHLFHFGSFTNLHWDGNTSTGIDRNYAQAIALGASFDPQTLASSVRPYDLLTMEETARRLTTPAWPAEIFGPLDLAKVTRGAALFRTQGCAGCHAHEGWHKLEKIGTDPNRLVNYALPVNVRGGRTASYATNLYTSSIAVKNRAFADNNVSVADQYKMNQWHDGVDAVWRETLDLGYFTRPLRGLWATAPFLHNGSVPTLWHLLQPADQRPKKFAVGHREFDPVRVGYVETPAKVIWEFDTAVSGNRNTGHEFGTRLTEAEKWDLLEYLKTL